jgi:hypothetical protein
VVAFDPQQLPPAKLIRRVTSRHAIRDLFVENPPIEQIIARLYEAQRVEPARTEPAKLEPARTEPADAKP